MALTPQERKKKEKLAERRRRELDRGPLAFDGDKYKKPKLAPVWLQIETAIYQIYILTDKKLSDQTVIAAIERLVRQMKAGPLPPLSESQALVYGPGREEDLLIENIRSNWAGLLCASDRPAKEDLIGVLRSILSTINDQKSPGTPSQGYLLYIARFLSKQLGVTVKKIAATEEPPRLAAEGTD